MKAYGSRLIVKPTEVRQQTTSGLYIPNAEDQSQIISGTVVSIGSWIDRIDIGEGGVDMPTSLAVGAVVFFNKFGSFKLSEGGQEYYSVKDEDILGIGG